MGWDGWFKSMIGIKRRKQAKNKQIEYSAKKSNSGKKGHHSPKVPGDLADGLTEEVVRLTEEVAAIRIQRAFRAYITRKRLHRLKGIVRIQGVIDAHAAKSQASSALSHIHFWSKIQSEIRARWIGMVTEGRIKQKKLENQLKLEAKLHEVEVEWSGGSETMEEILNRIQQREEAAARRERAMAYAFSHQWRANSNQYLGQAYYDLSKDNCGWSWKERWIAVRPWERRIETSPSMPKKVDGKTKTTKTTSLAKSNIIVSVKPHLSNGKESKHARKLSSQSVTKQTSYEANHE